jgi:DNA-binding LacI/PurR family transcriptional regulator
MLVPRGCKSAAIRRTRAHLRPGVRQKTDRRPVAALAGVNQLGLTSPTDLALIDVDDTSIAALSHPPLTNISRDHAALAETIVNRLEGKPAPRRARYDHVQLIKRATS